MPGISVSKFCVPFGAGGVDWSSYWTTHNADLDFHSDGLQADGLSLVNKVGAGGALKQFKSYSANPPNSDYFTAADDSFLMLDGTATYEYYLEMIFNPAAAANTLQIMTSNLVVPGGGWKLMQDGVTDGFLLQINDGSAATENQAAVHYFDNGLNKISIKFNLPTKEVTININGHIHTYTHAKATVFDVSGNYFILHSGVGAKVQQNIYFKMLKNNVVIKEFFCGDLYGADGVAYRKSLDTVGAIGMGESTPSGEVQYQDLSNPYINGYDLYWVEDTMNYQAVSPVNSLGTSANPNTWGDSSQDGTFPLFKRVLSTELGYHILNYIEMPNLPIFDTTDRAYWKVSIESDPYYVGGTAGREKWFHKTWLDFDWIDAHIETAYKGLLVVQCLWKKATGGDYVKIKVENIVVLKAVVTHYLTRQDTYESEDLGNFYQSFNMRSNSGIRYPIYASLGLKRVILDGNFLKYSADGGHTYNAGINFSTTYAVAKISRVRIASNGNILIFSNNKLVHYSDDNLATVTAASVVNADDSPYVFHVPADAALPGGYFALLNSFVETDDCIVIGNYANSASGASPINFYYSLDYGVTWKVFYTYGQNPQYTDDGTADGGTGGTAMGDVGNPIITTRVEGISIGYDGNIYIGTEGDTTASERCGTLMKCVYNAGTDAWTVTPLLNATSTKWNRMRINGAYEKDGVIYWASASVTDDIVGGITYSSRHLFKCAVADINDITKHVLLSTTSVPLVNGCGAFKNNYLNGKVLANFYSEIHLSNDYGETWEIFDNIVNSNLNPVICDVAADEWNAYVHYKIRYIK